MEHTLMADNKKVYIFENPHALSNFLFKRWLEMAKNAIHQNGRFLVALPGGKTPSEFFCKLSLLKDFELWQKIHVFLTDERFVPVNHLRSNFRMLSDNLLNYVHIPTKNIHKMDTHFDTVYTAAESCDHDMKDFFGSLPAAQARFDLVILGVGEDGHTASLFEGEYDQYQKDKFVIPVSSQFIENDRISLSLPVINKARHVMFLVMGDNKSEIIRQILSGSSTVPAARILPEDGHISFLLDRTAAKNLNYRSSTEMVDDAIVL